MGFDPRRWRPAPGSPAVTSNVEGPRFAYGLSPDQVERWGQAMAAHPRWQALRIGPPAGLRGVIEELRHYQRHRGTRTENHSQSTNHSHTKREAAAADPRGDALRLLGLEPGASQPMIKRAYRRLAKAHHPDLGGDAQAFHRLEAAYRLLMG